MKIAQSLFRRASLLRLTKARCTSSVFNAAGRPSPQLYAVPLTIRQFSSEAQTNLIEILSREEQEEVDTGNTEIPQELVDLRSVLEDEWRIVDDGATTQLFLKNKKVTVSYHCQDTVLDEETEEDDDDEEEESMSPVRFTVSVSKTGKTLVFNCLSELGQANIESVVTTTTNPDAIHASQGALEKTQYQGPDFFELAEDLQDAFSTHLEEECGITSDLATFVAMHTDYKEQMQYVQFLKDAQSIIS